MESNLIIGKIHSQYIIQNIFEYINIKYFKYSLFKYSKFLQNKLSIKKSFYQELYLDELDIKFTKYFKEYDFCPKKFDKDILKNNLKTDLSQYSIDLNILKKYIYNKLNFTNFKPDNNEDYYLIDIYSPFFDDLSKSEYFDTILCLPINIMTIEKFNLKNDYILTFSKLNKLNLKYPALKFQFIDQNDINYFKEFKLNFKNIKKLHIYKYSKDEGFSFSFKKLKFWQSSKKYFFNTLFSFKDIEYNLIELSLVNYDNNHTFVKSSSFENINNLKSLENLYMNNYYFDVDFVLKLYNLKILKLYFISNLGFDNLNPYRIKYLKLKCGRLSDKISGINFPELEIGLLNRYDNSSFYTSIHKIINFNNLNNLKKLVIDYDDFKDMEIFYLPSLEELEIINESRLLFFDEREEKDMIKKLLLINTLKKLVLQLKYINNDELLKIEEKNYSITELILDWNQPKNECIMDGIHKLFPNLINLEINSIFCKYNEYQVIPTTLFMKEDHNCKIIKFKLYGEGNKNIDFNFQSYETIKDFNIKIKNSIENLESSFPIFNNKSKIIFKSLNKFKINIENISLNILENIYNNLINMPNIKIISIICGCKEITKAFYDKLIIKLLQMNLDKIKLIIKDNNLKSGADRYLRKELKELYPNISNLNYKNIYIEKNYKSK